MWICSFLRQGKFQSSKFWIDCEEVWAWVPVITEALYMILSKPLRVGLSCLSRGVQYHLRCPRVHNTSVQSYMVDTK